MRKGQFRWLWVSGLAIVVLLALVPVEQMMKQYN